jgi:hypothetical protein
MHPLVRLNRSYCARDITLQSVFDYLRATAPGLVVEVPDIGPQAPQELKPVTPEVVSVKPWHSTEVEEPEEEIKKPDWIKANPVDPYDDLGAIPPMD